MAAAAAASQTPTAGTPNYFQQELQLQQPQQSFQQFRSPNQFQLNNLVQTNNPNSTQLLSTNVDLNNPAAMNPQRTLNQSRTLIRGARTLPQQQQAPGRLTMEPSMQQRAAANPGQASNVSNVPSQVVRRGGGAAGAPSARGGRANFWTFISQSFKRNKFNLNWKKKFNNNSNKIKKTR